MLLTGFAGSAEDEEDGAPNAVDDDDDDAPDPRPCTCKKMHKICQYFKRELRKDSCSDEVKMVKT